MQITKIREAVEGLSRELHISTTAERQISARLVQHLADVALGTPDNGLADQLRQDLEVHQRTIAEHPSVITELLAREGQALIQADEARLQMDMRENDTRFFNLLDQIIETGTGTRSDLAQLCRYAAASSNPARRYDMERLTDALEDHARKAASAKTRNQPLPTFQFKLEEQQGGAQ